MQSAIHVMQATKAAMDKMNSVRRRKRPMSSPAAL